MKVNCTTEKIALNVRQNECNFDVILLLGNRTWKQTVPPDMAAVSVWPTERTEKTMCVVKELAYISQSLPEMHRIPIRVPFICSKNSDSCLTLDKNIYLLWMPKENQSAAKELTDMRNYNILVRLWSIRSLGGNFLKWTGLLRKKRVSNAQSISIRRSSKTILAIIEGSRKLRSCHTRLNYQRRLYVTDFLRDVSRSSWILEGLGEITAWLSSHIILFYLFWALCKLCTDFGVFWWHMI